MNLFSCCCLDQENDVEESSLQQRILLDVCASISKNIESTLKSQYEDEQIMQEVITHVELFLPINKKYYDNREDNIGLHKPTPLRKTPTIENLLESDDSFLAPPKRSDPIPIDHTNTYLE
jgi:hypothetical protein